ncbi:MAG: exodeoxyribonuclease III [Myxococcales bacterium]|nr:exodeoxyribonuclease III [Myxococcales bacterium]
MKIATWNVNSVRARLERVLAWLAAAQPDVLCMQEIKVVDDGFPVDEFRAAGYEVALSGQRTYNGVAIAAREAPSDVARGLDDGVDDPQARLIAATVGGVRVISAYVPNGQAVGSDKYAYKLEWLARLRAHLDLRYRPDQPLCLAGDFNVAPEAIDVHDPAAWEGQVLCSPPERAALARVAAFGLEDTYRIHHKEGGRFTWWDYRMLSFPKDKGLRIDHLFATPPLAARSVGAEIDRDARKGKLPSDHAPLVVTFA